MFLFLKNAVDNRYSDEYVVSHNQNKIKCQPIKEAKEIFNFSKEIDIVGIDETQFFDLSIIDVCNKLANDGKRVIVAGLDRDYKSIPFKPMANLLAHAEKITKLSSICIVCGDYAYFSQRLTDDKTQILVGETDEYEARCRKCFKP